jgi:hypothetical protein
MDILFKDLTITFTLVDPATDDGVDVFECRTIINGVLVNTFFECPVDAELWDVVPFGIFCLKDSADVLEVPFG